MRTARAIVLGRKSNYATYYFTGHFKYQATDMLIRAYWKNCKTCGGDALWVEATKVEAESVIFPRLSNDDILKSKQLSNKTGHMAEFMGHPDLTFCFLISKDLSFIRPFEVHYPINNLWNAYSPFKEIPAIHVAHLDEICGIDLPEQ